MTPSKIEYDIGSTIHSQPLRLIRSRATSGQIEWTLCRDEADQRDDRVFISGLTRNVILAMADAVKEHNP